jgi:Flp pilus assembly protein TadD
LKPGSIEALSAIAWLLATQANADSAEAREFANSAVRLTEGKDFAALDALAAAQAAAGDFAAAVATGERALALAPTSLHGEIRARIDGYREQKPYRRGE